MPLATYEPFADRVPATRAVLEQTLASVSRRQYRRTREPVGKAIETWARSTSKTAMSRTLVESIPWSGFRPRSTRSDSSAFATVRSQCFFPRARARSSRLVADSQRDHRHPAFHLAASSILAGNPGSPS